MPDLNWQLLGTDLRQAALDAHDGELPDVDFAYGFFMDNPECFGFDDWPPAMPAVAPIELVIGLLRRLPYDGQ